MVNPFLVPFMLKFRDAGHFNKAEEIKKIKEIIPAENETCELKNRINLNESDNLSYRTKINEFLQAPIVKFAYDKILYLAFLILFSYVLLCDFKPISTYPNGFISPYEIVLMIWVFSFLIEKFHRVSK